MLSQTLLVLSLCLSSFYPGKSVPLDGYEVGRRADELNWGWSGNDYPNPETEYQRCRQNQPSSICDPDGILTANEVTQLGEMIKRIHNNSPCLCGEACQEGADSKGVVIGIALMRNLQHPYHADLEAIAHNFSKTVMKNWNLGSCDNGILLFLSVANKQPHIEVGSAVTKYIKEETITEIFDQCKGHLNDGHYYQGLESIINSLYNSMQQQQRASGNNEGDEDTNSGNIGLTVGLVVGFACLAGLFAAGIVLVRRRRNSANQDKFMYDGSGSRPGSRGSSSKRDSTGPIVKTPVVFPSAVYQPCSVEDGVKTGHREDEEDEADEAQYLRNLEENPAYESADTMMVPRTLSVVDEASPENSPRDTLPPVAVHHKHNLAAFPTEHRDIQT